MKKLFLGLFVVSLVFFVGCGYNHGHTYSITGEVEEIIYPSLVETENSVEIKTSVTCDDTETKILKWKDSLCPAGRTFESVYGSTIWLLYPAERVPDNIKDHKIEVVYRIVKLKNPIVVYVVEIRILDKN